MQWLSGIKYLRLETLKVWQNEIWQTWYQTGDFQQRLQQPHVLALARSIKELGGSPAHLPIVVRHKGGVWGNEGRQ